MADITLQPMSPLDSAETTIGTIRLREITDTALLSLAIPQGGDKDVAKALKKLGLDMPDGKLSSTGKSIRAIRSTPDQLILFFKEADAVVPDKVREKLGKVGYLTVQTDNWVLCEISGPDATTALERICPIDLHDTAFPVGAFARTSMEHLGAAILRTDATRYTLMSASSSAQSFWHALETSARYVAD